MAVNAGQQPEARAPGHPDGKGGKSAHIVLTVLFLIYMSDYADRMVVAGMIDFIKQDLDISDAKAGWLMSVVLVFITVFSAPASLIIDRWSRRKMVAIMTFFWSMATLACRFASGYWQLLAARALIGIGEAGYASGGAALLSAAYSEKHRGRVFGIFNAAIPVGAAIGILMGGYIAANSGDWRHAFGVLAIPGMLLAAAAWFLPDYKTVARDEAGPTGIAAAVADLKAVLRARSLVFCYLGFAMNVSCTTAMSYWLATYFERTGAALPGSGGALATPIFLLVLLGVPLGGFAADAMISRFPDARLLFPAFTSFLAGAILLAAFSMVGLGWLQYGALIFYGIVVVLFIAPALAVTQDVVHPGMRAFSVGMCVLVQHLFGDIWSPIVIGKLSDLWGLHVAVLFVPAYCVLAGLFFYLGRFSYVEDKRAAAGLEVSLERDG